jgi:hypothetical protein
MIMASPCLSLLSLAMIMASPNYDGLAVFVFANAYMLFLMMKWFCRASVCCSGLRCMSF